MTLKLYDTMARDKRLFEPADAKRVTVYVCGPTVWNRAHIGNARPPVIFDVLIRLLRRTYGADHVVYARNLTDVDDKINQAAKDQGVEIGAITRAFTDAYHADMDALGVARPDIEPRATQSIDAMIAMIESLIASGHAYAADGHVLFNVPSFDDYGALSARERDEMIAGARVEVAPYKKDPADFVLWKPSTPDLPGWDSPWGRGRPGWHVECSAMIERHLGETIDIHGGGLDLVFPHHENEIAQSRCAHGGKALARYWVHNGFLSLDREKMSKSLGNVLLVHDLLAAGVKGEVIRYALLSAHYRQPLDWSDALVEQSRNALDRYYRLLLDHRDVEAAAVAVPAACLEALEDDLNTPKAFAALAALAKDLSTASSGPRQAEAKGALLAAGALMGLLQADPQDWFQGDGGDDGGIEALIAERKAAKQSRDFARADAIRDRLKDQGILLEDKPGGETLWRRL
ncbi:MAG: cysteine--tRNA ligase [Sphingomonadales bacterium]